MASRPPDQPESITLSQFAGIRNTVAPERLLASELETAVNIDLDDSGQPRRRRGYTLKIAGRWHSLHTIKDKTYGVKDGTLGIVRPNYTFTTLQAGVGPEALSYTQVGERTYFSSLTASGVILPDETTTAWGAVTNEGTWLSPVIAPTDTLGAIRGKLLGAPPMATQIAYYKGRIYMACGNILWATELYLYDYVDRTRNFVQLESDITLLMAMDDGLYVGTEDALYFLSGTFGELKQNIIQSGRVLPGSGTWVPSELVHPSAQQGQPFPAGEAAVFMTQNGICAGFDGGQVFNLTSGRVIFPQAVSAAALFRQDIGANHFVAVTDSGGTPSANTRIGDYVSAEIRRFQG